MSVYLAETVQEAKAYLDQLRRDHPVATDPTVYLFAIEPYDQRHYAIAVRNLRGAPLGYVQREA